MWFYGEITKLISLYFGFSVNVLKPRKVNQRDVKCKQSRILVSSNSTEILSNVDFKLEAEAYSASENEIEYNHSEKSDEFSARNTIHGYEAALERITHSW